MWTAERCGGAASNAAWLPLAETLPLPFFAIRSATVVSAHTGCLLLPARTAARLACLVDLSQPRDHGRDGLVWRRCAGGHADPLLAVQPFGGDLILALDLVRLDTRIAAGARELARVGAVAAADHDHQVDVARELAGRRI